MEAKEALAIARGWSAAAIERNVELWQMDNSKAALITLAVEVERLQAMRDRATALARSGSDDATRAAAAVILSAYSE